MALDEYRFQVTLNWGRTEHSFTLNAAITSAAIALLHFAAHAALLLVAGIFFVGAVASVVAGDAVYTQHGYYRSTREQKAKLEHALNLGMFALSTTPGMGSAQKRRLPLYKLYIVLLLLIAVINLAGSAYASWRYVDTQSTLKQKPGCANCAPNGKPASG